MPNSAGRNIAFRAKPNGKCKHLHTYGGLGSQQSVKEAVSGLRDARRELLAVVVKKLPASPVRARFRIP